MNENAARGFPRAAFAIGTEVGLLTDCAWGQFVGGPLVLVLPCGQEFPARRFVFGPGAIAVASEDLSATHIVVAVSAPVGIARLSGLLRLLHVTPPDSVTRER
jgi:hypothetical protein